MRDGSKLLYRAASGLAFSVLMAACSASTTSDKAADIGTSSSATKLHQALSQSAARGPLELHKVVAATWTVDREGMINLDHPKAVEAGIEAGPEDIELYVYVIRHPEHGDWIIDSGVSTEFAGPDGSPRLGWVVRQAMNMDALRVVNSTASIIDSMDLDLKGVLISHLHMDHIMGVSDAPQDALILAGPSETATRQFTHAFTQGTTDRLLDNRELSTWQFSEEPDGIYSGVIDVFGDGSLWAIHSPGHTEGSVAFVALTKDGAHLLLGDVTHTAWGWENGVEPGTFSHDIEASANSLQRLVELAERFPALTVHPGHQSLAVAAPEQSNAPNADNLRLYVMDCGSLTFDDVSSFGLDNSDTDVREMFVPCYLIEHERGRLLWDAGLPLATVGQGDVELQPGATMRYERSVVEQLSDLGLTPEDIDYFAPSHLHFDHIGAANTFAASTLLIQRPEYEAGFEHADQHSFFEPGLYSALASSERVLLEGAHDVFGDGSVEILPAYGHTPGHQVLFLDLEKTGPILLSGDLYHFRFSRQHRRTPVFNADKEATLAAMTAIENLLVERQATLWIEHDKVLADQLNKSPAFYN
ncbi:MAG: MBL fold metallo-hydrolase [Pseudomonadaceae bacterium]|nr:MBL fold metallo-hydrolase [Pseudomonadaceae bacterium]